MKLGLNYQRPNLSLSVANRKGNTGATPPVITPPIVEDSTSASGNTLTFGTPPADGEVIYIIGWNVTSSSDPTLPSGFTLLPPIESAGNTRLSLARKVASGETGVYTYGSSINYCVGIVLSNAGALGQFDTNLTVATTTTIDCAAVPINIAANSLVVAVHASTSGAGGARSFNNGFGNVISPNARLNVARRTYIAAANTQNCTVTTGTAISNRATLFFEVLGA